LPKQCARKTTRVAPVKATYIGNLVVNTKLISSNGYRAESALSRQNRAINDKALLNEPFPVTDVNKVIVSSDMAKDKGVNIDRRYVGGAKHRD
jgi:hypothetical protein